MSRVEFWDARRNRIISRKGGWQVGRGVNAGGYSLLDDLALNKGFFEVLYLHVCGRLPERRLARWLEASFICLSFPDARIWCNQIGALAQPDDIRFAAALPKTRSGKIMRRLLRDIAAGHEVVGDTSTLEDYSVLAKLSDED